MKHPATADARRRPDTADPGQPPAAYPAAALQRLPPAVPDQLLPDVPLDSGRDQASGGLIVHPRAAMPVYDLPDGQAVARLAAMHGDTPTWLPCIDRRPGWVRVLLPARPAGATGWLIAAAVDQALSRYEFRVDLDDCRLQMAFAGRLVRVWPIDIDWLHQTGRTFLYDLSRDDDTGNPAQALLPIANLGAGGCNGDPATVALHTGAPHNGCLTIPPPALAALARAPLGSLVRVIACSR